MSDQDGKKTLGLSGGARNGRVNQSFSRGRTKSVVVETKRKRVVVPKPGSSGGGAGGEAVKRPSGVSDAEMERRLKALQAAKSREAEEAENRAREEREREEERERRRAEIEAKEREEREREEALKAKEEDDQRRLAEEEARRTAEKAAVDAPAPAKSADPQRAPVNKPGTPTPRRDKDRDDKGGRGKAPERDGRRTGKLTVNQALAGRDGGRQRSMAAMKRKQERARQKAMGGQVEREKIVRDVQVPDSIIVSELANRMAERVADVVKALMNMGMMVTQNQPVDQDTAELIVEEFGHNMVRVSDSDVEQVIDSVEDKPEDLVSRPFHRLCNAPALADVLQCLLGDDGADAGAGMPYCTGSFSLRPKIPHDKRTTIK